MNKIQRGSEAEAMVLARAIKEGYKVSIPFLSDTSYDLVFESKLKSKELFKVQVKRAYWLKEHNKNTLCVETRRFVSKGQTRK